MQSTLGTGTAVASYDPALTGDFGYQHDTIPLSNLSIYGVQTLRSDALTGDLGYAQAFPTGSSIAFSFNSSRNVNNSPFSFLNPQLNSSFQLEARRHLLAGRGFGPNLRYLRIARNNQKISDQAFELQVASTVTQIANIYWDLVAAYEDEQVKSHSLDFANQTLTSARKQRELQAIPALDILKDEAEVANREGDLSIARSQLRFQQLIIKNALTKNLDDPILEAMPVRPLDLSTLGALGAPSFAVSSQRVGSAATTLTEDLVTQALTRRIELAESTLDLQNRSISRDAARNALLPSLDLVATYGGSGLAGAVNPNSTVVSTAPAGFGGSFTNA